MEFLSNRLGQFPNFSSDCLLAAFPISFKMALEWSVRVGISSCSLRKVEANARRVYRRILRFFLYRLLVSLCCNFFSFFVDNNIEVKVSLRFCLCLISFNLVLEFLALLFYLEISYFEVLYSYFILHFWFQNCFQVTQLRCYLSLKYWFCWPVVKQQDLCLLWLVIVIKQIRSWLFGFYYFLLYSSLFLFSRLKIHLFFFLNLNQLCS